MKKVLFLVVMALSLVAMPMNAQGQRRGGAATEMRKPDASNQHDRNKKRFDPERYQRDLEAFITKKAALTAQEATAFFPLFREMQAKQRALFAKHRQAFDKKIFTDNAAALNAIVAHDEREIEIKKILQVYHKKFLKVLPATKVLKCIHAEEEFNKIMMNNIARSRDKR